MTPLVSFPAPVVEPTVLPMDAILTRLAPKPFQGQRLVDTPYVQRREVRLSAPERWIKDRWSQMPRPIGVSRQARRFLAHCNALEAQVTQLGDSELSRYARTRTSDAERIAALRDGARRTLGMRHHDVQLLGAFALAQGQLAEMQTGEGKSLVAALAAAAQALQGCAVHVVTVNDYLAERDAEEMQAFFAFFGLRAAVVKEGMEADARRAAYLADITYVSNKEIVFDYLKDQLASQQQTIAQQQINALVAGRRSQPLILRGLHVAIIDEADSVLVDEARTPLILSRSVEDKNLKALCETALDVAKELAVGPHFTVSPQREIWVNDEGLKAAGQLFSQRAQIDNQPLLRVPLWQQELLEKALKAIYAFERDVHYIVREDKVQIVDEFTGRVMEDRSWEQGLHQMIEAKEGVELTDKRDTLARLTYQRFFTRYLHLCGMTGTGLEVASEMRAVYNLGIVRIPSHKPNRRAYRPLCLYLKSRTRWHAIAQQCRELSAKGRSVLIGTESVSDSESLSAVLHEQQVDHVVLNARQDAQESAIVAAAGQPGVVTIATNMAGRGTDIKLAKAVEQAGGLHVVLSQFSESARVDRQLVGRCARQGNPGSTQSMASLEDALFQRHGRWLGKWVSAMFAHQTVLPAWLANALVRVCQRRARSQNDAMRRQMIKSDREQQRRLGFIGEFS